VLAAEILCIYPAVTVLLQRTIEFCRNVEGTLKRHLLIFSIAKAQSVLLVCLRG